jgi:hypothetical protein
LVHPSIPFVDAGATPAKVGCRLKKTERNAFNSGSYAVNQIPALNLSTVQQLVR